MGQREEQGKRKISGDVAQRPRGPPPRPQGAGPVILSVRIACSLGVVLHG